MVGRRHHIEAVCQDILQPGVIVLVYVMVKNTRIMQLDTA
jgi:hypothetical protein